MAQLFFKTYHKGLITQVIFAEILGAIFLLKGGGGGKST